MKVFISCRSTIFILSGFLFVYANYSSSCSEELIEAEAKNIATIEYKADSAVLTQDDRSYCEFVKSKVEGLGIKQVCNREELLETEQEEPKWIPLTEPEVVEFVKLLATHKDLSHIPSEEQRLDAREEYVKLVLAGGSKFYQAFFDLDGDGVSESIIRKSKDISELCDRSPRSKGANSYYINLNDSRMRQLSRLPEELLIESGGLSRHGSTFYFDKWIYFPPETNGNLYIRKFHQKTLIPFVTWSSVCNIKIEFN